MPRPLFTVTSAARLDITAGSPTRHIYFDLVAQYQFGTPVIYGRSPQELATTKGLTFYNAVGDPGIANSVPGVVVVSFPYPTPSVEVGARVFPVDVAVGGGTIVGANFIDQNGQFWADVDWQWTISVEAYDNVGTESPGRYDQQVATYVGDGGSNVFIPSAFPLDVGVVGIWIAGGVGNGIGDINCFRYRGMPGTSIMGNGADPDPTVGVMSFGPLGFQVTAGDIGGIPFANRAGHKYTAIIMRDTTKDNRFMRVGTYPGVGNFSAPANVDPSNLSHVTGSFSPEWSGLRITDLDQGTGSYTFTYISAGAGTISGPFRGSPGGVNFSWAGAPRVINTGGPEITHLWVWGVRVAYRSVDFVGDNSMSSLSVAAVAVADNIKSMTVGGFQVGAGTNVNANGTRYDYVALSASAAFLAQHLFASFKTTGAVAPPTPVAGFGFTPDVAFAERFTSPTLQSGAIWRGPDHTGTDSAYCALYTNNNDVPTQGIRSLDVDGVTIGTEIAPSGVDAYGWAFKGGGFAVPAEPIYVPVPPPPPPATPKGGIVPPNVPAAAGQGCRIGSAGLNAV